MDILGTIFTDTSRLHHRYHHTIFESFNLHRGQCRLLGKLQESEGISQRELAGRMNVTAATLTRIVQNMEKNSFITRQTNQKDQRVTLIHLTPKGVETRALLDAKLRAVDNKIFKNFTADEKSVLQNMLLRIQDQLLLEINSENDN